jgi:hypothetical protein
MGEQNKSRRWIVLLNKAPKGPFTAEEIQELLAGGILRRNDLACVVEDAASKKSEWKLIWQYVEFDRRGGQADDAAAAKKAEAQSERRKIADAEAIRAQAVSELPENWEDIPPEDLIPHSTSSMPIPHTTAENAAFEKSISSQSSFFFQFRWAVASLLAGFCVYYFYPQGQTVSTQTAVVPTPKVPVGTASRVQAPRRLPAQNRVPLPSAQAPQARPPSMEEARVEDDMEADEGEVEPMEEPVPAARSPRSTAEKTTPTIRSRRAAAEREAGDEDREKENEEGDDAREGREDREVNAQEDERAEPEEEGEAPMEE